MAVDRQREPRCVNPFCDGYGNLDVSVKRTGAAWQIKACEVGPHDEPNPMVASATSDDADLSAQGAWSMSDRIETLAHQAGGDIRDLARMVLDARAERDELHDTLRFVVRRFLHKGPNGQRCQCEDCSRVRRAVSQSSRNGVNAVTT